MSRWKRQAVLQVAALLTLAAVAVVARAAPATPISLKGTQTVVDEKKGSYKMHGSLLGDLGHPEGVAGDVRGMGSIGGVRTASQGFWRFMTQTRLDGALSKSSRGRAFLSTSMQIVRVSPSTT